MSSSCPVVHTVSMLRYQVSTLIRPGSQLALDAYSDRRVVRSLIVADRSAIDVARRQALRSCGTSIGGLSRPSRPFSTAYDLEHLNGTSKLAAGPGLIPALIEKHMPGLSSTGREIDLPLHNDCASANSRHFLPIRFCRGTEGGSKSRP